jgi:hypothetical protein
LPLAKIGFEFRFSTELSGGPNLPSLQHLADAPDVAGDHQSRVYVIDRLR